MSEVRLTELSHCAGWAAKINQEDLVQILSKLPKISHPNLIVGSETGDDAAVYQLDKDISDLYEFILKNSKKNGVDKIK